MAGRLKYGRRYRYPHMLEDESGIWERFMDLYPDKFESVDYDFRVGKGVDLEAEPGEPWPRMAKMLSQKRIDVIGWAGDSPTIIEVKKRVGLSALGQVLGYKALFKKEFKYFDNTKVLVVCETISEDDRYALMDQDIPVIVV